MCPVSEAEPAEIDDETSFNLLQFDEDKGQGEERMRRDVALAKIRATAKVESLLAAHDQDEHIKATRYFIENLAPVWRGR